MSRILWFMSHSSGAVANELETAGVVAVIRVSDPSKVGEVVGALVDGGVKAMEVTMTVPGAVELIRRLAPTLPDGFLLGAGTVTDAETARQVIDAGARFVVSPVYRPGVVAATRAAGAASLPGCLTPTEILEAWDSGADIVKVFPATTFGPGYLKDVRAPLPHVKLMPTGGVTVDNAGDWISAGAVAVGIGAALIDKASVEQSRFDVIVERAKQLVANVRRARGITV
jgi:2-dehydro-3-deoxyphosphogluconate aldolase/(4S)-4-hydroxy-2-oxoglutarate aldolase